MACTLPMETVQLDREIRTSRWFDAPPDRIFEAFSDPGRLARWWGPAGFSNTIHRFDFREGGSWSFTMHGPDGTQYPNRSRFLEILPGERIQIEHISGPRFVLQVSLAPERGGTLLEWRMRFETAAECDSVRRFAPAANEQNLDRLAGELG
jgi:uncharacterized protein YndB with AHSA1/START domain